MSGNSVLEKLTARASRARRRILLAEAEDPRVLRAAEEIVLVAAITSLQAANV